MLEIQRQIRPNARNATLLQVLASDQAPLVNIGAATKESQRAGFSQGVNKLTVYGCGVDLRESSDVVKGLDLLRNSLQF